MSGSGCPRSGSRRGRGFASHVLAVWLLLVVALLAPQSAQAATGELEFIQLQEIAGLSTPEQVLAARPFVVAGDGCPEFCFDDDWVGTRPDEAAARDRLIDFLRIRNLDPDAIASALGRFEAPETIAIIPNPTLRASLLMLSDWDPYQAIVTAILEGRNQSGLPYADVSFADLGPSAIAFLDASGSRYALRVNDTFATEAPETLVNVLIHEAIHDPFVNSFQEEVIANVLDGVAYAEMVLLRPDLAKEGSTLTVFNNFALLALLNSSGPAGPSRLGVSTSRYGDVWVGEDFAPTDAASLFDAIAGDSVYAALPSEGSPGNIALATLLRRFSEAPPLGAEVGFNDETLATIDRGIGTVISPAETVALATALDLSLGGTYVEFSPGEIEPHPGSPDSLLRSRPLVPRDAALFDPTLVSSASGEGRSDVSVRAELAGVLASLGIEPDARAALLAQYDAIERVPEPSLRAAWVLATSFPGAEELTDLLGGDAASAGLDRERPISYAPMLHGVPCQIVQAGSGGYGVAVNRELAGAPLALLAVTLVEAVLTIPAAVNDELGTEQAVLAAAVATVAYAHSVMAAPDLAKHPDWCVTRSNRALLALLNSAPVRPEGHSDDPIVSIGVLDPAEGIEDVLPNLYPGSRSYEADVQTRPGAPDLSASRHVAASPLAAAVIASLLGVDSANMAPSPTYGDLLGLLDARLGAVLPPESVARLAGALDLGVVPRTVR